MADGTTPKRARRQSKDALEFYETPADATRAILPHLPRASCVLDPCAGRGAILKEFCRSHRIAIEINDEHRVSLEGGLCENEDVVICDAFDRYCDRFWADADLVIANPPFSLAQAFVEHALAKCSPGTTLAFLLRLAFLEGKGRAQLHREHPSDVFVFSKRPSFSVDGKTDSAAYAWFVWGPGRGGRWRVLP